MRFARGAAVALVLPAAALVVLVFIAPVAYFLRFSLNESTGTGFADTAYTLSNYARFFSDPFYYETLLRTVLVAASATAVALVLALPAAYCIARSSGRLKNILIIATVFPFFVGNIVRSIGWAALLGYSGPVKSALVALGLAGPSADLLGTPAAVTLAIASVVLPFMVLTLHASFESVDPATERAALSLGATPLDAFRKVVLPQVVPGIIAGTSLVFVLCMNAYATPFLVGGNKVLMMAPEIYQVITSDNDWPFGASMAAILLALTVVVTVCYGVLLRRQFEGWRARGS